MPQARETGPDVADLEPDALSAERGQRVVEGVVVLDVSVFGELEDDPLRPCLEHRLVVLRCEHGRGRHVDDDERRGRRQAGIPDGSLEGGELELHQQADRLCFGQPGIGTSHRETRDAGGRFDADDDGVLDVEDRTELRVHGLALEHVADAALLLVATVPWLAFRGPAFGRPDADVFLGRQTGDAGRPVDLGQQLQRRRLAGAVRSDDAEGAPALDGERDVPDRPELLLAEVRGGIRTSTSATSGRSLTARAIAPSVSFA